MLKRLFISLMLVLAVWQEPAAIASDIAPLPTSLQARVKAPAMAVLLVFHANWCGACKRMRPYEVAMVKQAGKRLKPFWVDVDAPAQQALAQRYHVTATPTYYLFGAQSGKPLFVMNQALSAPVLQAEVQRFTGQAKQYPVPVGASNSSRPLVLVVAKGQAPEVLLKNLSASAKNKVLVLQDTTDKSLLTLPALSLLLLDKQGRALYQADSKVPATVVADYLELFITGEP
jgi:thiol-disulfide isomerase/thioredoxin